MPSFLYHPADREVSSLPPVVDEDASVAVPAQTITTDTASFSLTADKVRPDTSGLADDIVLAYRIELQNPATGEVVYNARFMSDYYRAQADQAAMFTRELIGAKLSTDTTYLLNAYALNAYDKETFVSSTMFRAEAQSSSDSPGEEARAKAASASLRL